MDDKEKPEETKTPEVSISNIGEGDKPKTTTLIDDTNLAAKRLEEATKEAKEERLAKEESYAKMRLGGISEAGQTQEKKVETDEEYHDRFMKGEADPLGDDDAK